MDLTELPLPDSDRDKTLADLLAHRERLPFTGYALSPWIGGRSEGLRRLRAFPLSQYAGRRSIVGDDTGASQLGPWIRHGLVSLPESREHALRKAGKSIPSKFIQELAWREYFQLVRATLGDNALWADIEPSKVAQGDSPLPDDIRFGTTGLACIDSNIERLRTTGYVVNQARMWLASYVIHHRRVRWQDGAAWFLQHLLDGDPASNNLSWQWVGSTFSHQPYLFSRGNVERFSNLCDTCPKARRGCPFSEPKEIRLERLQALPMAPPESRRDTFQAQSNPPHDVAMPRARAVDSLESPPDLIWVHGDHLAAPANPLLEHFPQTPLVFVLDTTLATGQRISVKRFGFLAESFAETARNHPAGGRIVVGDPADILPEIAPNQRRIATTATLGNRFQEIVRAVTARGVSLDLVDASDRLTTGNAPAPPRFSRWWGKVEDDILGTKTLF